MSFFKRGPSEKEQLRNDKKQLEINIENLKQKYNELLSEKFKSDDRISILNQQLDLKNKEIKRLKNINEQKIKEHKNEIYKLGYENNELKIKIKSLELHSKETINDSIYYKDLIEYGLKYPRCQRDIIETHVDSLCDSIKKCPNFITYLYLGKFDNEYYVLDGQHRLEAIKKLKINPQLKIEIIEVNTEDEINDLFLLINNSLEVSQIYKDPNISINEKKIIRETIKYIQKYYKGYISKGRIRTNRPFINISNFQKRLYELNIIGNKKLTKSIELINLLNSLNEYYDTFMRNYTFNEVKGLERIRDKIQQGNKPFYIGIASRPDDKINWEVDILNEDVNYSRVSISRTLRKQIWKIYIGEIISSKCLCCTKEKIDMNNFEAGHMISVKNGGLTNINNLRPICKSCNRNMSDISMFEYMYNRKINISYADNLRELYQNNPDIYQK